MVLPAKGLIGMICRSAAMQRIQVRIALCLLSVLTAFYAAGDDITIDYLSANLPNHSRLGIEGSIKDASTLPKMDIAYYGAHVDLSLLQHLDARIGYDRLV